MNFLATVVLATAITAVTQDQSIDKPVEPVSYTQAFNQAKKTGRPILVLVTAKWCGPCQLLKRNTLPTLLESDSFRGLHFAMVDVDEDRNLAQQLTQGGNIPQFILYEKVDGQWSRTSLVGNEPPQKIANFVTPSLTRLAQRVEAAEIVAQAKR